MCQAMSARRIASTLFIVFTVAFVVSILAFANIGQALLSNGECIRFLHVPFTDVRFRVGGSILRVLLAFGVLSAIMAAGSVCLIRKRPNG